MRARLHFAECVSSSRETGNLYILEGALYDLAEVAVKQGDYSTARELYREVLGLLAASRQDASFIEVLEVMAELAACMKLADYGVRLFAAAAAVRERSGSPVVPGDRADYDRREWMLRSALSEATFAREWTSGYTLTTEQAIAKAIDLTRKDPA